MTTVCCLFVVLIVANGCAGGGTPVDPTPSNNYLFGEVTATDEFSNVVIDRSGIEVTLYASDGSQFRTQTDSAGGWRFYNMPPDVYAMRISSQRFTRRFGVDSIWNMQYVGRGAYQVQEFRVASELS